MVKQIKKKKKKITDNKNIKQKNNKIITNKIMEIYKERKLFRKLN